MKNDFDLTIIGAGIIGAMVAWYARKQYPGWRICLIDQSSIGSGATHYSASLDIPYGHTPLRFELAQHSRALYVALRQEIPGLPVKDLPLYGIVQEGNASLTIKQFADAHASLSPQLKASISKEHPLLSLPPHTNIIAGSMASQGTKNELASILCDHFEATADSSVMHHTKIINVSIAGDRFELQTAGEKRFHSKKAVQATGPWMNEILGKELSASKKTRIKKIVAFHIYQQPKAGDPVFYFFDDDAFLMPKYEDGYWLFSFKCDHWDVAPDIDTLSIDEADLKKAQSILQKYYPSFAPLCIDCRVFCNTYTEDRDPVIERAAKHRNYIIAGACAGSGYRLAPAIAQQALNLL